MINIAENINIMSKTIGPAMRNKDPQPIRQMVEKIVADPNVDYLDLNIGPARKGGDELMSWLVEVVQEITDLPLFLDTTNHVAVEAGLKVYKEKKDKAVINSVDAKPQNMEVRFPMAATYNAGIVALTYGTEGIPRDENERAILASELLVAAAEYGISEEDLWLDPIVVPVSSQQQQVQGCSLFTMMIGDFAPSAKSTCGLSNVSNGSPDELRPILNQAYLIMLKKYGMYGAIVDGFDKEILNIAKGNRPDLEKLVGDISDGNEPDMSALNEEELKFAKTAKILLNHSLYSDSWLDL
jgi:5-methyltetrahydrofolate corrinoid/iron sulfur protein methyltransferase